MKKESKRILGLFLLGILFTSVLVGSIGVVSAEGFFTKAGDKLFGGSNWYENTSFSLDNNKQDISRYLMMFLVALLVYSISDSLPFFPKGKQGGYIKGLFAIVVAILSFLFIDGNDIEVILTNYEALGVALTSIIPLLVILLFAYKIGTGSETRRYSRVINTPLLLIFGFYTIYKWWIFPEDSALDWIYIFTLGLTIVILVFYKYVFKWINENIMEGDLENFQEDINRQDMKRKAESESTKK